MSDSALDEFRLACGAPDAYRLRVEAAGEHSDFTLSQPFAILGSSSRADVVVPDAKLRDRHAYFQFINGNLAFVDLSDDSGPLRVGWLEPGQAIDLGAATVRRLVDSDSIIDNGAQLLPAALPVDLPSVLFDVAGRGVKTAWRMKRPIAFIGSSFVCRIRLADGQVSRFHCALVNTPTGLWVVDLISTNGIKVDKRSVRFSKLLDGSELRICSFVISPRNRRPGGKARSTTRDSAWLPHGQPVTGDSDPAMPAAEPASDSIAAPVLIPQNESSATTQAALSPLVLELSTLQQRAFAQMQQQMADQFQQSMNLFVEAFWAMHREQSKQVRREFRQIRRLTKELEEIRRQLNDSQFRAAPAAPAADSPASPAPAAPASPTLEWKVPPAPATPPEVIAEPASTPKADPPQPPAAAKKAAAAASRAPRPTSPIRESPADMHGWLNQRVAEIQRQRQSSWQRIMNLLQGKSADTPPASPAPQPPQ